jgi:hypothetical protein
MVEFLSWTMAGLVAYGDAGYPLHPEPTSRPDPRLVPRCRPCRRWTHPTRPDAARRRWAQRSSLASTGRDPGVFRRETRYITGTALQNLLRNISKGRRDLTTGLLYELSRKRRAPAGLFVRHLRRDPAYALLLLPLPVQVLFGRMLERLRRPGGTQANR